VTHLILKRAWASRPSGQWNDDDFDVLAGGAVVGRILKVHAAAIVGLRQELAAGMSKKSAVSTKPVLSPARS
jgi:hypothetical protein